MFVRGTVKKSTVDVILLTAFKRIIGMNVKFVQITKTSVSLTEVLLQIKMTFVLFFVLNVTLYDGF